MCARSMTRSERSSIPQSQATAILPAAPSGRGMSFQPVPLQSEQFSSAMRTAYVQGGFTASCVLWENCGRARGRDMLRSLFGTRAAKSGLLAEPLFRDGERRVSLPLGAERARCGAHNRMARLFVLQA